MLTVGALFVLYISMNFDVGLYATTTLAWVVRVLPWMYIPPALASEPELTTSTGSATVSWVVFTVVVLPEIVKFPVTVKSPPTLRFELAVTAFVNVAPVDVNVATFVPPAEKLS